MGQAVNGPFASANALNEARCYEWILGGVLDNGGARRNIESA
jgi:hypothetical protein